MSNLDEIAQRRLSDKSTKAELERQASIDAFLSSSRDIVRSASSFATSGDIAKLVATLSRELQTANAAEIDKFEELGNHLAAILTQLNSSDNKQLQKSSLEALHKLAAAVENLVNLSKDDSASDTKHFTAVLQALESIELAPVINVPQPKVTVKAPVVDLKPLENTLREYFTLPEVEKIDLECYKAQDIDNSIDGMQYVGFVNPDGAWYIIENDIKRNSLRYVFGNNDYAEAFSRAGTYKYLLLNEAIDALST